MDKVLPLFKSHYSIGRSILTLHPKGSSDGVGPDSIIDICADSGLKELYLVDDSMTVALGVAVDEGVPATDAKEGSLA